MYRGTAGSALSTVFWFVVYMDYYTVHTGKVFTGTMYQSLHMRALYVYNYYIIYNNTRVYTQTNVSYVIHMNTLPHVCRNNY